MSCADIEPRVALYAGGELDEALAGDVERHLAACADCRTLLLALREQHEAMAGSRAAAFSQEQLDEVRNGVLAAIARGDARRSVFDRIRFAPSRPVAWGSAGLAAAALVLLAVWAALPGPQDVPEGQQVAAAPARVPAQTEVVQTPRTPDAMAEPADRRTDARSVAPRTSSPTAAAAVRPPLERPRPEVASKDTAGVSPASGARETVSEVRAAADVSVAPTGTVRRIEFQTADPNIRIIWLIPEQAPDPNRSGALGR